MLDLLTKDSKQRHPPMDRVSFSIRSGKFTNFAKLNAKILAKR